FLQELKRAAPQVQMEHIRLARQQIVFDPDSRHRVQVTSQDSCRYVIRHLIDFAGARFKTMQGLSSILESGLVFFVETPNPRIQIPTVVIESTIETLHLIERHSFQVLEAYYDIGHLNASVVDVVLNLDPLACGSQHPDGRVAEHGVSQMTDMGCFVW